MSRLFPRSRIAALGVLLALPLLTGGCTESTDAPLVALEVKIAENTLDGCTACGCRIDAASEPGTEQAWWASFGVVAPDNDPGWQAISASSHCGLGSFEDVALEFTRTVGTPHVILDLATTTAALPTGGVRLDAETRIRKLTGFDRNAQPVYARSVQKRSLAVASQAELALPLLIPDARERESFRVHEVLLRLRATPLGRELSASYGRVSVSADAPGAEVLLDGGRVGRIADGRPILLKNVPAGTREIRVRDYSGREARRDVVVPANGEVDVAVEVLGLTSTESANDLVPVGENPQGYPEYWRVRDAAIVVEIPAGEFLMGSPDGEGAADERPQHRVHISAFLIDKTEVTWRQFRKFAEATGAPLPPTPVSETSDDYPVAFILWQQAKEYCEWAGGRLPTEAEWEKAARGTDGRSYTWGNAWDPNRCNSITGGMHRPESVGSYPDCVSPYGVLDMSGSMWEWCADRYGESYYAESASTSARDPQGPTTGRLRVKRGAAWMSQPTWLRVAYRAKGSPTSRNLDHGFRCAQDGARDVPE